MTSVKVDQQLARWATFAAAASFIALAAVRLCGHYQRPMEVSRLSVQLEALEESFPKVDSDLGLYRVNDAYLIQPACSGAILSSIHVVPNYYFQKRHPEWREPQTRSFLFPADYERVIKSIDALWPLGRRLQELRVSSHNAGLDFSSARFEKAIISGGFIDTVGPTPVSFGIFYFRPVSGVVEAVRQGSRLVLIDGLEYWGQPNAFEKTQPGDRLVNIELAGPADSDPVTRKVCRSAQQNPSARPRARVNW